MVRVQDRLVSIMPYKHLLFIGHDGIAGSPRSREFTLEDSTKVVQELNNK